MHQPRNKQEFWPKIMESRADQSSLTLTQSHSPLHSHMTSCIWFGKASSRISFSYGLGTSKGLMKARRSTRSTQTSGNRLDLKPLSLQRLSPLHLAPTFQTLLIAFPTSLLTCGPFGVGL